jgi:hypothetical protein
LREEKEAPGVALSRAQFDALAIPVWSGQISQRAGFLGSLAAGASAGECDDDSVCKTEIARLWSAVERSVDAINLAHADAESYRAACHPPSPGHTGKSELKTRSPTVRAGLIGAEINTRSPPWRITCKALSRRSQRALSRFNEWQARPLLGDADPARNRSDTESRASDEGVDADVATAMNNVAAE